MATTDTVSPNKIPVQAQIKRGQVATRRNETFIGKTKLFLLSESATFLKLNIMLAILFWILIYHLSEAGQQLPNFVYVNF